MILRRAQDYQNDDLSEQHIQVRNSCLIDKRFGTVTINVLMKNKKLIIGIAIGVLVILGIFLFISKKSASNTPHAVTQSQTPGETLLDVIPPILPDDIGLSLTSAFNNRKVLIQISKIEGISSIDYQLSYVSKGNVPRGIIGQFQVKQGKSINQEIVLGTCSDVCHYDEGVTSVELTLKVIKTDNKTYQLVKTLAF